MKAPALPLFGDAYMADTRHLSLEEHGAYVMLLLVAWRTEGCRLPDDDKRLARILGISPGKWAKLKPSIMPFWTLEEGHWTQKRLTKERDFVEEKSAKNKAAAEARWSGQTTENKQTDECERTSECNAPPPSPPQGKKNEDANASSSVCLETDQAVADWNMAAEQVGWPTIRKASDPRKRALRAILKEHGLEGWRAALAKATASGLLGARPPPTWFTFDWIVKPANFLKLIEGNYDRPWQSHSQPVGGFRPHAGLALIASANEDERAQGFAGDEADYRGAFPEVPGAVRH